MKRKNPMWIPAPPPKIARQPVKAVDLVVGVDEWILGKHRANERRPVRALESDETITPMEVAVYDMYGVVETSLLD